MIDDRLQNKLDSIEQHYVQIEEMMAEPEVATDHKRLMELGRERAELTPLVEAYRSYKEIDRHITEAEEMREGPDPDVAQMAREELEELQAKQQANVDEIKRLLLPKDPNDDKNVIIEIRA